jgi:hypothetical protein
MDRRMTIVYVSELRPDLLDDVSNNRLFAPVQPARSNNLKSLLMGGGNFSHAKYIAVDLSAVKDSTEEICEAVSGFGQLYPDIRLVFLADREPPESPIFNRLFHLGVYNVARDISPESLYKCFSLDGMTQEEAAAALSVSEKPPPTDTAAAPGIEGRAAALEKPRRSQHPP